MSPRLDTPTLAPTRPRLYPCPRACGYLSRRANHACCRPCIWRVLHPESLGQHSAHCEAQQVRWQRLNAMEAE